MNYFLYWSIFIYAVAAIACLRDVAKGHHTKTEKPVTNAIAAVYATVMIAIAIYLLNTQS